MSDLLAGGLPKPKIVLDLSGLDLDAAAGRGIS
jgi:hypothetical protein